MKPGSVVEALDEGKDIALGLGAGLVVAMMNEFGLQAVEEAFHRGIIIAIGLAAHRCDHASSAECVAVGSCGIVDAAIGVVDQSVLWPLLLDRHRQRRGCEFDLHMISHGPADDLSAEEIHDGRQVQPTLRGRDVGDIGEPDPVRGWAVKSRAIRFGAIGRS